LCSQPLLQGEEPSRDARVPKFELDIQPILTARGCNSGPCHGKSRGQNGFSLSLLGFDADWDYRAIVEEGRGRRLFPAAPDQSLLLVKGAGLQPHGGGVKLEPYGEDWQTIRRWLEAGMPRTSPEDPTISGLRIEPPPRSMQPEESIELSVIAIYSDGSEREVTPISAYQSNEPAIVSVASDGKIQA
ncbi:MAG: Ig domain-containing protein, partial [Pirellulaceae bacterium]